MWQIEENLLSLKIKVTNKKWTTYFYEKERWHCCIPDVVKLGKYSKCKRAGMAFILYWCM